METTEKILFSNSFGSVTDKRIILNYKSGTEDLPIGQITSVSYQHKRNYVFAIGSFLITIGGLVAMLENISHTGGAEVLIILLFVIIALLSGIANWIGHHNIQISAGGKDRKPLKAEMSKTREGREFVDAVKRAVIK
ncbi:MAG: hypothetical protein FJX80_13820 [Bacteroidetes bacterium]|nr:hypothetical protein [Bacteroidota bacterium]